MITKYYSSKIYHNILKVVSGFIKPKLLTPELYGLWNILDLISSYASYAHLGSRTSMRYTIPYHEAKNEQHEIENIKGSVFHGSLYPNALIAVVLIALSFILDLEQKVKLGLLTMAAVVILHWYYEYYVSILRSYQNFRLITSSNYLYATLAAFFSIFLIYMFSIYGAYISAIISCLFVILYLRLKYPLGSHSKFQYSVFYDTVKKGAPIMMYEFVIRLIRTSDKIIISFFLSTEQLGYYGIGVMTITFLLQIPRTTREVIEPRLMQSLNNISKEKILNEYLFMPFINIAYILPFLIGPVIIILPILIPIILPRYVPAILPAQIIALGGYFLALAFVTRGIIVANNWQFKAMVPMAIVLIINIILSIFLLKLGWGIIGVAVGSSISYLILFISLLIFIRKRCHYALDGWKTSILGLCWPFPIMCGTLTILEYIYKDVFINEHITALIKLSIFCIVMILVVNQAQRKYVFLKEFNLKKIWQKK